MQYVTQHITDQWRIRLCIFDMVTLGSALKFSSAVTGSSQSKYGRKGYLEGCELILLSMSTLNQKRGNITLNYTTDHFLKKKLGSRNK